MGGEGFRISWRMGVEMRSFGLNKLIYIYEYIYMFYDVKYTRDIRYLCSSIFITAILSFQ